MSAQKGLAPILVVLLLAATAISAGLLLYQQKTAKPSTPKQVFCTQEAKFCPDGSSVGRSGPKCEFSPCPTPTASAVNVSCQADGDCLLADKNYANTTPNCCQESSDPNMVAFNASWYQNYRANHPVVGACNVACTIPQGIQFQAKCIKNTCQKVPATQ